MPRSGELRARVQFRRAVRSDDGYQQVETWSDLGAPIRARRRDVSDGERAVAGWIEAEIVTRFVIRERALAQAVTPRDRVLELGRGGREYQIAGVKRLDPGWIEITAIGGAGVAELITAGGENVTQAGAPVTILV